MPLTGISDRLAIALVIMFLLGAAGPRARRFDPFELRLGTPIESATAGFAFSTRGPQRLGRNLELLPRLFESQNLVLESDEDGGLAAIHIQVIPSSGSTGGEVLRLADQVRSRLIERFGAPSWEQHEGDAPAREVLFALSNGEIIRTTQWEVQGRAIRSGIPRRVDGRVLVEIVITSAPLPRHELFWSAE